MPAVSSNQREPLRRLSINNNFLLPSVGGQGEPLPQSVREELALASNRGGFGGRCAPARSGPSGPLSLLRCGDEWTPLQVCECVSSSFHGVGGIMRRPVDTGGYSKSPYLAASIYRSRIREIPHNWEFRKQTVGWARLSSYSPSSVFFLRVRFGLSACAVSGAVSCS